MRISKARFAATAGLALTLAFGAIGCSTKTEVTTSDGETTTTTTTETKDGETTTTTTEAKDGTTTSETTTTTDPSALKSYSIDAIGMVYNLPEDLAFSSVETDLNLDNGPVQAFMAKNEKGDNIILRISKSDGTADVTTQEFMDEAIKATKEVIADEGYTLNESDLKTGTIELEGITLPTLETSCNLQDGTKIYQKQAYATGDNGSLVLTFTTTSADQAMLDTMLKGITAQG